MKLDEVRRRLPVTDRSTYEAAYHEADLAGRVAELVHAVRERAGMSEAELAERMGIDVAEVAGAEEGLVEVGALDLLYRLGRAVGMPCELRVGEEAVTIGEEAVTIGEEAERQRATGS